MSPFDNIDEFDQLGVDLNDPKILREMGVPNTGFCRNFCYKCGPCRLAWAEVKMDEEVMRECGPITAPKRHPGLNSRGVP